MFGRVERFKIRAGQCLGLVGTGCAVTTRPSHDVDMAVSRVVCRATAFGRSSRLALAVAGHSEPLATCSVAQPLTATMGAAAATLHCHHVCTADASRVTKLSLPSYRRHIRAGPLHLCTVAGPMLVAFVMHTWVSHHGHAIYGTMAARAMPVGRACLSV